MGPGPGHGHTELAGEDLTGSTWVYDPPLRSPIVDRRTPLPRLETGELGMAHLGLTWWFAGAGDPRMRAQDQLVGR